MSMLIGKLINKFICIVKYIPRNIYIYIYFTEFIIIYYHNKLII